MIVLLDCVLFDRSLVVASVPLQAQRGRDRIIGNWRLGSWNDAVRPRAIPRTIECCAELGREPSGGESAWSPVQSTNPARAFAQAPNQAPRAIKAGTINDNPESRRRINTALRKISSSIFP